MQSQKSRLALRIPAAPWLSSTRSADGRSGELPAALPILAGAAVNVDTQPAGAANDAVTEVTIGATDTRGTLAQLDAISRRKIGRAPGRSADLGGRRRERRYAAGRRG